MPSFVSNYDVLVVVVAGFSVQIAGLVALGSMIMRQNGMLAESQRLTKAVAGLVVQEEEKTRAIVRQH